MAEAIAQPLRVRVGPDCSVSALLLRDSRARWLYVLAHGAGAGMRHASLETVATELAECGVATLRYQFPYMERGAKRPDPAALCHATVRAAAAEAALRAPDLPLFAGGRSFGGRMTSQAQALEPLPHVRGLVFLAFPLHPPKRPSRERAAHLVDVRIPMLFLQGSRDELADLQLLEPCVAELGDLATLHILENADHSFHVPVRSGRTDADVRREALTTLAQWMGRVAEG